MFKDMRFAALKKFMAALAFSRVRSEFARAFSDSIPVMAGYGTMGFAAGVLLAVHGGIVSSALWGAV